MSIVNTTTLYTEFITANTISVGNASSNMSITSNSTSISIGSNVIINTTAAFVGNATVNSVLTSSALTTNSITINGTTYNSITVPNNVLSYNTFTTTGWNSWTKPAGTGANDLVTIMMWGGGGGGNTDASNGRGGGGGACLIVNLLASQCNATCNVYVASGGAAGLVGQTSVFWTNSSFSISAYGGGAGGNSAGSGGGGGGWFSAGQNYNGQGGGPLAGSNTGIADSTFGGSSANSTVCGSSVYGGTAGALAFSVLGSTIYGAGGGYNTSASGVSNKSVFGGQGGNNNSTATSPGGGGGGGSAPNAPGARGEVRIWVQKVG